MKLNSGAVSSGEAPFHCDGRARLREIHLGLAKVSIVGNEHVLTGARTGAAPAAAATVVSAQISANK